jgi:general secretion pathway protein G
MTGFVTAMACKGSGLAMEQQNTDTFNSRRGSLAGFTFVEVLVAGCIIATLAAVAIPVLSDQLDKANNAKAIAEILSLEAQITLYQDANDGLPDSLNDLGAGGMLDPWGNAYEYAPLTGAPSEQPRKDRFLVPVNTDFDLYSMGKDGDSKAPFTQPVSHDDIVRASNGAYVGLASEF